MNGSGRVSVLRALLGIVVLVSLAGAATGVNLVDDLDVRGEMFDGLAVLPDASAR